MASPIDAIIDATCKVTNTWAKQIRAEERDQRAVFNRHYRLVKSARTSIREVAFEVMEEAYLKASGDGEFPANARSCTLRGGTSRKRPASG